MLERKSYHHTDRMRIVEDSLFFDLECADAQTVFAMGAVFREHTPLHARNAAAVKKDLPILENWGNAAQFICGHNALAHDIPIIRNLGYRDLPDDKVLDTLYLSPLAFPKKPYHALIKDGKITSETRNNPVQDSRSCATVLADCLEQFERADLADLEIYWLAFHLSGMPGMAKLFEQLARASDSTLALGTEADNQAMLLQRFTTHNHGRCCLDSVKVLDGNEGPLVLAYIHSWLTVAGGESVLPYWLCRVIPSLRPYLKHLRQVSCNSPECGYCVEMHSPTKALQRHFGFEGFRAKPALSTRPDRSLQEEIVSTAMAGQSLLGILPTGGGKSLCFQIPERAKWGHVVIFIISLHLDVCISGTNHLPSCVGTPPSPRRCAVALAIHMGGCAKGQRSWRGKVLKYESVTVVALRRERVPTGKGSALGSAGRRKRRRHAAVDLARSRSLQFG